MPTPGPQNGRFASEPLSGLTSLEDGETGHTKYNASQQLAVDIGDTVKRIDGTEVPLRAPWRGADAETTTASAAEPTPIEGGSAKKPEDRSDEAVEAAPAADQPKAMDGPRDGSADDLKRISGVGPKLEALLNSLGIYHFDQIAGWSEAEIAWVDDNLKGFKGRVTRDNWIEQAKTLGSGGETEFSKRVDEGDVY